MSYKYNYNLTYCNIIEYQTQFLKLFNLEKYDSDTINYILDYLYKQVKNLPQFKNIIINNTEKTM